MRAKTRKILEKSSNIKKIGIGEWLDSLDDKIVESKSVEELEEMYNNARKTIIIDKNYKTSKKIGIGEWLDSLDDSFIESKSVEELEKMYEKFSKGMDKYKMLDC